MSLPASMDSLESGMDFIKSSLGKYRLPKKYSVETQLISEEWMVRFIQNAPEDSQFDVKVRRHLGVVQVLLSAPGEKLANDYDELEVENEIDEDTVDIIRSVLLRAYRDKTVYSHTHDTNTVRINSGSHANLFLAQNLAAFIIACIVSTVLYAVLSREQAVYLSENILLPIQSVFFNSLKLVAAPAIFFSITTKVARYSQFSYSGKLTLKTVLSYLFTSIVSVYVAYMLFRLFSPDDGLAGIMNYLVDPENVHDRLTLFDRFMNIVPGNIVEPFISADATQLLCIAILGGISLGRAGKYSRMLCEIADALDKFFNASVEIITWLSPFAVFFSTIMMLLLFSVRSLIVIADVLTLFVAGIAVMVILYSLGILVFGRANPFIFIKKTVRHYITVFREGSAITAIPKTLKCCDTLGISRKITAFSIPFGALASMNGNCIYMTVVGMLFARMYGVNLFGPDLLTMALTIVILSIASSITPGSALLALIMLLGEMGIPPVVLCLFFGINPVMEMFLSAWSAETDIAASLMIAQSEKMLDHEKYRSEVKK